MSSRGCKLAFSKSVFMYKSGLIRQNKLFKWIPLSLSLNNFSRSVNINNATHICMRAMRHDQPVYLHYAMRFTVLLKGVAKRFVKENNVVVNGLWNADNRQRPKIQRVKKTKKAREKREKPERNHRKKSETA